MIEEEHVIKQVERLLAVHGTSLLERAWEAELQKTIDVRGEEPE